MFGGRVAIILIAVGAAMFFSEAPAAPRSAPESFADLAEALTPSVVNISTAQRVQGAVATGELEPLARKFGGRAVSLGSGFIIDPVGIVVTNNHVIENADEITVTLNDGREFKAAIRGVDRETDLAVLQLDAPGQRFPHVTFGDSDKARVGDWVLAIGNPFGLGGSVTVGIISARNRDIEAGNFDDFIQTDAAINRGNSGGPLFDLEGKVIGVNTAIYSQTGGSVGVGFAVPAGLASTVVEQLLEYGETRRGWLGVTIEEMTSQRAAELGLDRPRGAVVTIVRPNSPAAAAGIAPNDVILEFNRKPVGSVRDLTRAVAQTPVGSTARVTLMRGSRRIILDVRLDRREKRVLAASSSLDALPLGAMKSSGLTLQKPSREVTAAFGLPPDIEGVVVTAVDPDSPAAIVLQPGDVILEIGWERITRPEAAVDKLEKLRNLNSGPVQIYVQRGDLLFFELLRP
ncbi:serine protease Do [Amphiplicatus metriothermophilus]|uniref:Serine protease Do n=2 Tax=Amphiplicatus metriothermophilus TaxID=1519374 RepID=A0A239PQQ1_9PROT|nr:serine protease Do [Amphiplicatus metriothermophilus]